VLNITRSSAGLIATMMAMQKFAPGKSEDQMDDVRDFMSWWTEWSTQPGVYEFFAAMREAQAFDYLGSDRFTDQTNKAYERAIAVPGASIAEVDNARLLAGTASRVALWGRGFNAWKQLPISDKNYARVERGLRMRDGKASDRSGSVALTTLPTAEGALHRALDADAFFKDSNVVLAAIKLRNDAFHAAHKDGDDKAAKALEAVPPGKLASWAPKAYAAEALQRILGWAAPQSLIDKVRQGRRQRKYAPSYAAEYNSKTDTAYFLDSMGNVVADMVAKVTPEKLESNVLLQLLRPGWLPKGANWRRQRPGIQSAPGTIDVERAPTIWQNFRDLETAFPEGATFGAIGLTAAELKPALTLYWALAHGASLKTSNSNFGWALPPELHTALHSEFTKLVSEDLPAQVKDAFLGHMLGGLQYNYEPAIFKAAKVTAEPKAAVSPKRTTVPLNRTVAQKAQAGAPVPAQEQKAQSTPVPTATVTDREQTPAGEISSSAKGLNAALTNPTELAKSKGNLALSYPVTVRGKVYRDAETAFQMLKPKERMDKAAYDALTDALMREILIAKFQQHPRLAAQVKQNGGKAWLETATHRLQDKEWGGVGRQS
jgi:hypothetical protein